MRVLSYPEAEEEYEEPGERAECGLLRDGGTVDRKVGNTLAFCTFQLSPELAIQEDCALLASEARGAGRSLHPV